jgi:alkanesulfonate monooxygenase SsuD/methylene tetrahydromethanopterin reductase-like flavin-dependent oxidoreductase (luciferase family)
MDFAVFLGAHHLDGRSEKQFLEDLTEQAVVAEELGFDLVWLPEHHFNNYNLLPDPLTMATRIFERTSHIKVGCAVFILPNHHPLQLAGRLAQLDVLYPGRFETAVGRGASGFEAKKMGTFMEVDESRAYFAEHVEVLTKGLRSDDDFSHHGKHWDFDGVTVVPRPVTKPMPSVWLSAVTPMSIYGQVHGCHKLGIPPKVITSPFRNPLEYLQEGYREFLRALDELGYQRSEAKFSVNRSVYCGETWDDAKAQVPQMINTHRGLYAQLEGHEKYNAGRIEIHAVEGEITQEEIFANVPFGDVEHCRDQVRPYAEMGVDQFSAYFDLGLPHETILRSMRLFSEEVMPEFTSAVAAQPA